MKERRIPQLEIIEAPDAASFTQKLNHRLSEIASLESYDIMDRDDYCAYIKYFIEETIPETLEEKYQKQFGRTYCCNDCPFLQLDPDRRSITHHCTLDNDRHRLKEAACEAFYRGLMDGRYCIVTPEQRQKQFDQMNAEELERRQQVKSLYQYANKLKNKELKAQEKLLQIIERQRAAEEALNSQPFYYFEMLDVMHPLSNTILHSYEINLLMYGIREELTEAELIKLAKELDADLARVEGMKYLNEFDISWESSVDLYESKKIKHMRENVW